MSFCFLKNRINMKAILQITINDSDIGISTEYQYNPIYFKNDKELAVKIINSTINHFKKEMINNGLASFDATPDKLN